MHTNDLYDYGFKKVWNDVFIAHREGYYTSVTDYHEHDFYEINLILSGNVKILTNDCFEEGKENRIVLTRPHTPHYISCCSDTLYSRIYLVFTDSFIVNYFPDWKDLSHIFGESGRIITISPDEAKYIKQLLEQIELEDELLGKRLLVLYLLHKISKLITTKGNYTRRPPDFIIEAISYIENNYHLKITAPVISKKLYIGRTKLLTDFKKHTGKTFGEYITICRLKNAILLLKENKTLEYIAEKCGFADSSGLIQAFKKYYNTTPYKYIKNINQISK
jgi:AraC-like DNA-binding protein